MSLSITMLHADFLEDLEIGQGRSQKTVENYDRYLKRFFTQQGVQKVADITSDAVRVFRRYLNELAPYHDNKGVGLATQNYHLIALRQFLKYLAKRDIAALSPDKVGLAKLGERDIDVLYPEEMDALLTTAREQRQEVGEGDSKGNYNGRANKDLLGKRDSALLEVLYSTGVRVAEAVCLNRDDLKSKGSEPIHDAAHVRSELAVRGKGNKVRVVFLSEAAREAVARYLQMRQDMDPALFIRHSPNTKLGESMRLTTRSVQRMIKKYARAAGLTKVITPHTLRHSFATDLLTNGADVRQVQQLLGHASITTTQVYTHLTDVRLKEVHDKYHRKNKA